MNSAFVENVKSKIKTPTAKSQANKERKLKKRKSKKVVAEGDTVPGTVYIAHIPHGFYEKEMRKYFAQFGKVIDIRLAKSRRSLKYKGYGYIQFKSVEVAKVAAEAMNNYLFFEKLLKCEYVPNDKLHPNVFKGRKYKITSSDVNRIRQNRAKSEETVSKNKQKRLMRLKSLNNYLTDNNIEFEIESFNVKKE